MCDATKVEGGDTVGFNKKQIMKLAQKMAVNYYRAKLNLLALVSKERAAKAAFKLFSTPIRKTKKKWPAVFGKAERLHFMLGNKKIRGYRFNKGGVKKVLIIHGFESSVRNFDQYIHPLLKKDYEVLAFDAPGHGDSDGKRIILPMYLDMIAAVYHQYGPIDSFMAHSFGGIALVHFLETIATTPQLKVALLAPMTETTTAIDSFFDFLKIDTEVRAPFENIITAIRGMPPSHYSTARALSLINAAVFWVHDEEDDITPYADVVPVIEKQYPHVSFLITKGLGHRRIYRDTKIVKAIVDFL
ncbi:MAG: alpha/beta hydrolase [Sphingobacteriales bacterium]|nr:MAG: alpha/beta hydrolase [Sphingobacteriales bacterium]